MTVLNKVSENLEAVKCMAGSAVSYNARRISILQSHAICLVYSTAERSLIAHALGPKRKVISCSFFSNVKITEALHCEVRPGSDAAPLMCRT